MDTDDFAVIFVLMLKHDAVEAKRSALLLFPHGPETVVLYLEYGEAVVFEAQGVVHARTPLSSHFDEAVTVLGIGFEPTTDRRLPSYWHPDSGWSKM